MSRTDKTRPLWVRIEDPANRRHVVERHDHREGFCDFTGESGFQQATRIQRKPAPGARFHWQRCSLEPLDWSAFGEFIARNCGSRCYACGIAQTWYGERVGRAYWRTLIRKMIKLSPEGIEDMEEITVSAKALRRLQSKHW